MCHASRPPDSRIDELARRIQAKREEIEATGLCQWGYRTVEEIDAMEREEFLQTSRMMYASARLRYLELAEPYLLDDTLREFSGSLVKAIGEISPEEALAALKKMAGERGFSV